MNPVEQQSSAKSNSLVEKLIRTVARAFYTDSSVIVLEILIREKYLREEEFAPRLKLPEKDVNKIIRQLESEMLIRFEDMVMDDGRTAKCYYIDYQIFVNVVRYRIDLMATAIRAAESTEFNEVFFQCPTCNNRYTSLEALKLRSADYKFICSSCCPVNILSRAISEPYYRLVEIDNRNKLNDVQNLGKKMDEQLNETDEHHGIFDLLRDLKNVTLIHNLPSDNRIRGIVASRVIDAEVQEEIDFKLGGKTANKIHKKLVGVQQTMMGHNGNVFSVNIENDEGAAASDSRLNDQNKKPRDSSFPEFLANSRVKTAESIIRDSFAMANEEIIDNADSSVKIEVDMKEEKESKYVFGRRLDEINQNSTVKVEEKEIIVKKETPGQITGQPKVKDEVEEEEDDVDWED